MVNTCPAEPEYTLLFSNSVDLDQLASEEDLDLQCLPLCESISTTLIK